MRIRVSGSFLGIRVGEPYSDIHTENLDAFKFQRMGGDLMIFDFDPTPALPQNLSDCKKGGWMSGWDREFKNQGD